MDKKLEFLVDSFMTPHIRDNFPKWKEFITEYFKYLDNSFFGKIINITDNNNPFEIYSELVDDYLNTYFKDVINIEKYGLTDANKRLYISLSKFIAGMRGNRNGFEFLFKSLTDFRFPEAGGDIQIDKITVEYEENESWWSTGNPYTYKFILDQTEDVMIELIESVHPAGFLFDFVANNRFTDTVVIEDEITMTMGKINAYDAEYDYDGSIVYGDNITETLTF